MRTTLSCVLIASVAGALAFPVALRAQDDTTQLKRDCELDKAPSCARLADLHRHGRGVPGDYAVADSLYERACALGDHDACYAGMTLNDPMSSGPKDAVRYAFFMQKTCDTGLGQWCLRLGLMYDIGMWVPKDTSRANALFKKGCIFGHDDACRMVRP